MDCGRQRQFVATADAPTEIKYVTSQHDALVGSFDLCEFLGDVSSVAAWAEQMQVGDEQSTSDGRFGLIWMVIHAAGRYLGMGAPIPQPVNPRGDWGGNDATGTFPPPHSRYNE